MAKRKSRRKSREKVLYLLIGSFLILSLILFKLSIDLPGKSPQTGNTVPSFSRPADAETMGEEPTEAPLPQLETVSARATISAQGDMLMHGGLFNDASITRQPDGTWDFTPTFQYLAPYTQSYDYALANLETTFGGDDYEYRGWPLFNCPDALADAMVEAGFDMLLTSNNHCYDTTMPGFLRTIEVSREAGLEVLGSRPDSQEPRYLINEINGIPIGMVSYTYTTSMRDGKPMLNGNAPVEKPELVNFFSYENLNAFYQELEQLLRDMEAAGAKATVLFIHWGTEYELQPNDFQIKIAQKLCDLGVDVIVGGHPHVVQPIDLLTSTLDPGHKTVCIYSLGNAVSNQRIEEMNLKTGHTEDGLLFAMEFEQYTDGEVYLASIDVLPTWVNLHRKNGGNEYNILPLDHSSRASWQQDFSLTEEEFAECEKSWQRTMDLVASGMEEANRWLREQKEAREEEYLRQAQAQLP